MVPASLCAWKKHKPCYGSVAKEAAIYPFKMCRAILEGLVKEMESKSRLYSAAGVVLPAPVANRDSEL